jgi:hypothetical protein
MVVGVDMFRGGGHVSRWCGVSYDGGTFVIVTTSQ